MLVSKFYDVNRDPRVFYFENFKILIIGRLPWSFHHALVDSKNSNRTAVLSFRENKNDLAGYNKKIPKWIVERVFQLQLGP